MKMCAYIFMEKKDYRILKTQWELNHKERGEIDIVTMDKEVLVENSWNEEHPLKNISIIA